MGVDAILLIRRVRADWPDPIRLDALSAGLCRDIGADYFFVIEGSGDDPERGWTERFSAHPFLSACLRDGRDESLRERQRELYELIVGDIGPRPERIVRAIGATLAWECDSQAPAPGSRYEQDGPTIEADAGEFLLQIRLTGRYYHEDYARGDPVLYAGIAEWLEANIPGCEVWYGGDSGGAEAQPFGPARRRQLIEHLRAYAPEREHWQPPAPCD